MGIFTRLRDIVSSNINAMLEKAEDPEKLVKLMIQEMEDTLVEVKANCAGTMATRKRIERDVTDAGAAVELWASRAELALSKDREDLAREALLHKRRCQTSVDALAREQAEAQSLVERYQGDIEKLETKLAAAREKHRLLIRRHLHARTKKRAESGIRRLETSDAWARFEQFENRIERIEAEAELVNAKRPDDLDAAFAALDSDDDIEQELQQLREKMAGAEDGAPAQC